MDAMMNTHSGPVLGLHPLFGPTTSTMDKQIVVVTPGRDDAACQWVIDQFSLWGAVMVLAGADEHDEIMEFVQSLVLVQGIHRALRYATISFFYF